MEKKWNLQDIKPAAPKRRPRQNTSRVEEPAQAHHAHEEGDDISVVNTKKTTSKTPKRRTLLYSGIGVAFIVLIILGGGYLLSGTDVTVYPRHREPTVNASLTAYREPQVGELSYETMTLEADGERQVAASGQEPATEQATGQIEIFNNTDKRERLIKNTRFESPDGHVFHITESAEVPAAHTDDSGERVPGSVMANVFAEEAGEDYNLPPTTFTVPGYKEGGFTALYENIYAESHTAFSGGFDGMRFIIDEAELTAAKDSLHAELKDALLARIDAEKPAGFVVFKDAVAVTYQSLPSEEGGDNQATIKEKAVLQIPTFEENEFASYIAAATIPGYEGQPVRIDNYDQLQFAYADATTSATDLSSLTSFDFKLTGKPEIVWTFDHDKLKNDLAGASKTALTTILGAYPAIEKAEAVVRPFWKRSFSSKADDINLIESLDE